MGLEAGKVATSLEDEVLTWHEEMLDWPWAKRRPIAERVSELLRAKPVGRTRSRAGGGRLGSCPRSRG